MKKRIFLFIMCIVLILSAFRMGWHFYASVKNRTEITGAYAAPAVLTEALPRAIGGVDRIAEAGDRLYLLDAHEGCLWVYDLGGAYQYTVRFYDHLNGAFAMAVSGDTLFVRDTWGDVYLFREDVCSAFVKKEDSQMLPQALDFEENAGNYKAHLDGSVWREGEKTCVIPSPIPAGSLLGLLVIAVLLGAAATKWLCAAAKRS